MVPSNRNFSKEQTMPPPETPKLTVDIVLPMDDGIVLIKRKNEPFEGQWALPGGFVDIGETVEAAAVREMKEETGLDVELVRLVGVYSEPSRDPRGHNVSIAFLANPVGGELAADTDAHEAEVLDPDTVELAFDHAKVVSDAFDEGRV